MCAEQYAIIGLVSGLVEIGDRPFSETMMKVVYWRQYASLDFDKLSAFAGRGGGGASMMDVCLNTCLTDELHNRI